MSKFHLIKKNSTYLLLSLSLVFLFTTGFTGCGGGGGGSDPDPGPGPDPTLEFSDSAKAAFKSAVDTKFAAALNKRGISVAVYKDGYHAWTYAAGYADGEYGATTGTAMTASTLAYTFSITKTMVSALVLKQIDEGLYTLNDTVEGILNDAADHAVWDSLTNKAQLNKLATVEQLLKHTSGMPDYADNLAPMIEMCNPDITVWTPADILNKLVYKPLANVGTYQNSNTNYILLGLIAEHKGGKTLKALLQDTFFTKLGINATLAPVDSCAPSNIARPYDNLYLINIPTFADYFQDLTIKVPELAKVFGITTNVDLYLGVGRSAWATGGIITTSENIAKWGFELYDDDGDAIKASVRTILKNSAPTNDTYGYGVIYNDFTYADSTAGGKYGMSGSAPGYRTLLTYEKNQRISVAILTNVNNLKPTVDSDAETKTVDKEALVNALFNAYKANK